MGYFFLRNRCGDMVAFASQWSVEFSESSSDDDFAIGDSDGEELRKSQRNARKSRNRESAYVARNISDSGKSRATTATTFASQQSAHWGCTFVSGSSEKTQDTDRSEDSKKRKQKSP